MLVHAHNGGFGYGYGFGAATLTQGKDFNCNAAICYGIGAANDQLFKSLQQKLNQLSTAGGYAQLVVDGFIGAATLAALQALSKIGFANPPTSKEQAALNAPTYIAQLDALIASRQATGQAIAPTGTPVTFQPTAAVPSPAAITMPQLPTTAAAAALPQPKSRKTLFLIAGGLAAVLVVGGVGYAVYRRRSA